MPTILAQFNPGPIRGLVHNNQSDSEDSLSDSQLGTEVDNAPETNMGHTIPPIQPVPPDDIIRPPDDDNELDGPDLTGIRPPDNDNVLNGLDQAGPDIPIIHNDEALADDNPDASEHLRRSTRSNKGNPPVWLCNDEWDTS